MIQPIRTFDEALTDRPNPTGMDVLCGLKHFAIITYAVPAKRFEGLFPERFKLDTITVDGKELGLISVVPFIDVDFTSAVFPFPKFTMGQTNYRIYIIDTQTGEKCVWFLGTVLDSWTLIVPRQMWNLPWHSGQVKFDCELKCESAPSSLEGRDATASYQKYCMETRSEWADASVELTQRDEDVLEFPGFPNIETALVFLTHPLAGFYYRRDGKLGTYRVWHKELAVRPARLKRAKFALLARMNLVSEAEQASPYSVLIEPLNEFTIYLPPKLCD